LELQLVSSEIIDVAAHEHPEVMTVETLESQLVSSQSRPISSFLCSAMAAGDQAVSSASPLAELSPR
jgi:hypothetical protein